MNSIAFIILNYNDAKTTCTLADSILAWDSEALDYYVVVVDNKSKDDSLDVLRNRYEGKERVDVISSGKNGGYSYGNNFGSRYAIERYNPEYIAIANPDILLELDTVKGLLSTFEIDQTVAMVSPVMKDINGNYSICANKLPKFTDDLRACFDFLEQRTIRSADMLYLQNHSNMIITEMLPGSFFVIKTNAFLKVGLLDENVFLFCEERIIGRKLKDNGYKLILRGDLFFIHVHSTSIKKTYAITQSWRILMESRYYYEVKYNHINVIQRVILLISMRIYIAMLWLRLSLYKVIKRKRR